MQSTQSEDLHVQIVHTGPTKCIHAPKSAQVDRLFTGGDDYLVRILPTLPLPGVEPHLIEDATEPITSLDADGRFLVTASEDGSVRLYRHHPLDSEGNPTSPTALQSLLRRESLPLRCVALERSVSNGKAPRVAICSDELIVKIIDVEDPRRIQLLDGHNRGLRSASWSPVAPLLVTCSTDGVARVTDLSDVEPKFVKSIEGILPITRAESDEAASACWHPSGTYFVMPSKAHELVIISAANDSSAWSRTGTFFASASGPVPTPSGSITALAFSPNGRYLASATNNGQVTVWETESRQAIRHKRADALVNAISWHPTKDALAWTDNEGSLSRWSDVVGSARPSPVEEITFDVSKAARGSHGRIDDIFAGTGLSDDEDDDAPPRDEGDINDLDDFVVDDESHSRRYGGADPYSRTNGRGGHAMGAGRDGGMMIAATRPQPAFQSTATPMRGQRRYLAYNVLGSIVAVEQESHQTISFESFDTSARRNFRFSDMNNICMADLAKQGILFAAKQSGDQSSSVFFKPFVAASNNLSSEWTFNLDQGEDVEAVALGGSGLRIVSEDGWEDQDAGRSGVGVAVVATSRGYLRFLSASGIQLYLWALGHPVVTLAVGARTALVIYRRTGLPSGGFQDLGYKVIDLANFDVIQDDALPLAKDVHVRWAGYNDQHQPAFYDSNGTLFVLDRAHRPRQGRWVPSLDTKRLRDGASADASETALRAASTLGYWPVALTSSKLMVLLLKSGRTYPEVDGTRHMIQELELQVPLIHREGGTGPLEEKSLRDSMLAMTARDVRNAGIESSPSDDTSPLDASTLEMSSDKALLQLIQLACKADKHGRALDAARALHSTRTLEAALKIAAFFHLSSLAERMVALKEGLEGRQERVEEESRRWCDPMVRGGPSYTNPALVDVMTRASAKEDVSNASLRKRASAALGEEFQPPSRSASGVLRGDRFDTPSSSSIAAAGAYSTRSPAPASTTADESMLLDDDPSSLGKENLYRSSEKRKSPSDDDFSTTRPLIQPNKKSNPFARTSSNKDKQMHKSTSFFERIEPFEKESSLKNTSASAAAAKQSLLTGDRKSVV